MHELVTPEKLAGELGVTEKTLAQWRTKGMGPLYTKLGGTGQTNHVRYRRADINAWLDAQPVMRGGKVVTR
ncbi:helix-turn-helix domain-containing protein [Streptomyces sp. NPDC007984]|uniref:helix-turn-helix transcriptional regulator n=1 Tax=Streptomyces sp. NPDC007984 TaxID=3364801 RepID=UPI0036E1B8B3